MAAVIQPDAMRSTLRLRYDESAIVRAAISGLAAVISNVLMPSIYLIPEPRQERARGQGPGRRGRLVREGCGPGIERRREFFQELLPPPRDQLPPHWHKD
jgi:hypothetical protein